MNFQSVNFIVFLLVMVLACALLRRRRDARNNALLLGSYYFYMCWDWRFGGLLALSTGLHYVVAQRLALETRPAGRRWLLGLSLVGSLGPLAYFKYANFFIDSAIELVRLAGWSAPQDTLSVLLPIGISFYTFQALSYVLDVYRGAQKPSDSLRDFALFVSFFPTVLAGPITRARELLGQFHTDKELPGPEFERGLGLVARGFIKKAVFSDVLAMNFVEPAFANPQNCSSLFLFVALYAFSFQIYMDVSGYTDIARGSAFLCGFRLPENFNRPYLARSVSNFWQRWHISMSGFFRDYVFISLGGSRSGNVYANLMLTFLAIGLWHGGGWNFLLYGALHGGAVCLERWWRQRAPAPSAGPAMAPPVWRQVAQVALVFHFVVLTRLLFRAADLPAAGRYLQALLAFQPGSLAWPASRVSLALLLLAAGLHWGLPKSRLDALDRLRRLPIAVQALALVGVIYLVVAFNAGQALFVYFMF